MREWHCRVGAASRPFALLLAIMLAWVAPASARLLPWADEVLGAAPRAAGAVTRAEALALAGTLGGAVALIELGGGQLLLEAARGGARATLDLGDDLGARLRQALPGLAGPDGASLVMTVQTARALGPRLDELAAAAELRVVARGLPPLPLRMVGTAGATRRVVEIHPGLVAPLDLDLPEALARMLAAPVRQDAIRVLPLFGASDADTLATLAAAAGDRMADLRAFAGGQGTLPAGALRDRILVAVGHVEGDAFVVRNAAGAVERVLPFADLEAQARAAGAALLLSAGCASFAGGAAAGFLRPVTDIEVAGALRAALAARTHAELLAGFAQPGNPFVITAEVARRVLDDQAVRLDQLSRHDGVARGASFTVRMVPPQRDAGFGLLQGMVTWYGIGAVVALCMVRRSRARFIALMPVLPNALFRPLAHRFAWLAREALFLAAAPVVGAFVLMLIIFTGGWAERDELHRIGWSFFLHPPDFLFAMTMLLGGWVLTIMLLGLLVMAAISAAWPLITDIVEESPGPVLLLAVLAALVVVLLAARSVQRFVQGRLRAAVERWPRASYAVGVATIPALAACFAVADYVAGTP
jgi:hypothetical protein